VRRPAATIEFRFGMPGIVEINHRCPPVARNSGTPAHRNRQCPPVAWKVGDPLAVVHNVLGHPQIHACTPELSVPAGRLAIIW
jgi:hypothetical protein